MLLSKFHKSLYEMTASKRF